MTQPVGADGRIAGWAGTVYLQGAGDQVRLEDLGYVACAISGSNAAVSAGGTQDLPLGSYSQAQATGLEDALDNFLNVVGFPWIGVGSVANIAWSDGTSGLLAINLNYPGLVISDGGSGIMTGWYAHPSFGYDPWAGFTEASAAIWDMVRMVTWGT